MGERTVKEPWLERVKNIVNELERRGFRIEATIVFGSWAKSGGGDWSDIDVLVVTDNVKDIPILERFRLATGLKARRVDVFLYTFGELESMVRKGNPLAISALIEGIPLTTSHRVEDLKREARKLYIRKGRAWIRVRTSSYG